MIFGKRTATIGNLDEWKKEGVKYVLNGRTKQSMPHNYQFYEDFIRNEKRLSIQLATEKLTIPHLIVHGDSDKAIVIQEAKNLHRWNMSSELYLVEAANHTFNSKHPWHDTDLPFHLQKVVDKTINFI